ncbi:MAG: ATP-binding protein [Acidobacteriia bacterium]|nr:ATP-binding protein [Terriglobia bacterium]
MTTPLSATSLFDMTTTSPAPPLPRTLADTGLGEDQVEQLLIKTLYGGEASGHVTAERLRLSWSILEPLVERARAERLVEVRGATGTGGAAFRYALTDAGRQRARQYLDVNQYVGAAPVPLSAYVAEMQALAGRRTYVDRDRLRQGFSHLVVRDHVFEQLGPALNAGRAVFLYGPPGNGKTVIAEGLGRALGGDMYVPHAIEVDGQIIRVFDPINHDSLEADEDATSVVTAAPRDRRWVRIRRPVVMVGGELTLDMLDLAYNPLTKFYEAPMQLKAGGGVFLVDDFGRQRVRPQDLLNRWIVPLESRVDYLTLHTGKKFQVPFDVFVVFATNLNPESLVDEAFLRRIPYKIPVENPTVDEFAQIFELNCRRRHLRYHSVMVAYLQRRHYLPYGRPLRACHPRDLLDQVTAICRYRGVSPKITRELLDRACASYFIDGGPPAALVEERAGFPHVA